MYMSVSKMRNGVSHLSFREAIKRTDGSVMSIDQQNDDEQIDDTDDTEDYSAPALVDPVAAATALTNLVTEFSKAYKLVTTDKAKAAQLRAVDKLDRRAAAAEQKFAAITAQAEQLQAALDARAAELAERERALDAREVAFASQAQDVRDELREHHNHLEQTHRQLTHRIMASAGILGQWNFNLQDPPTWQQLRQLIADLPADLPAAPPAEVISENVREDWAGNVFAAGATVTRSINKAASQ
jgi:hypothetical protein